MRTTLLFTTALLMGNWALAQNKDNGLMIESPKGKGFYYDTILKDATEVEDSIKPEEEKYRFVMDQSKLSLPNKVSLYKREWANPPISQGNAGTCWDFSTTSFYESEIFRLTGRKVKLSEAYIAYWEYVEKARRFVRERGNSLFDEGSQSNALTRLSKQYGLMPQSAYSGLTNGRKFHNHAKMVEEMTTYLESVKTANAWNESIVINTIREILKHHMGEPPTTFGIEGKEFTSKKYMAEYLKFNPDDYVEILSYKHKPFWQKVVYDVPDNWWISKEYYNVPVDDFMKSLKTAIRKGYTVTIGGDVSEAGLRKETQCALVPDFDIPSAYINDDARQMRFANESTTDDHGMHLVGYLENFNQDGKDWYLIKDSSAGSRNNDKNAPEFGYYFFHEDFIKLKMMGFTIHKEAVKELISKFK
jgi:bleomycin hydrolase